MMQEDAGVSLAEGGWLAAALGQRPYGLAVATHRMPVTTDVEALRHDAEAPTVSPD